MSKEINKKTVKEMFNEIKELECGDTPEMTVGDCLPFFCEKVDEALTEYEAIKNANPTKALECFDELDKKFDEITDCNRMKFYFKAYYNTIKQALIQKSKKEQALDIVVKKNVDMLLIKKYDNASDYNSTVWLSGRDKLTDDEFKMIKNEVEQCQSMEITKKK